ncbi:MBL fold metallo-hydrolase [Parasphaerochaeta coccoides]|uniref:Beta-lactamase domain protein n=1 Tax=Parasphaerochaeta coccoides (strain ATCC BAA-1237 / DSM 17374 / SPN1) TaxID=760011 RepID=F4GIH2_PARC1|nr:MBL fold metallo-hydrolase [Parasphaerochaeta coccoides]AEC01680.1 beta-lactamase domain protein [Parasphaerochaeta coccoides DSM 17374]
MKIFPHFSVVGFCNTYLVGGPAGGPAIIIDPGYVDNDLINLIQKQEYVITDVLFTHSHDAHVKGVGTLMKVYRPRLHGAFSRIRSFPLLPVSHNEIFSCAGLSVMPIHVPGHSIDSMVYRIGDALFTGDALASGHVGSTSGYREHALLVNMVTSRLLSMDDRLLVFPGHGAPSSILIEKLFNRDIEDRASYLGK